MDPVATYFSSYLSLPNWKRSGTRVTDFYDQIQLGSYLRGDCVPFSSCWCRSCFSVFSRWDLCEDEAKSQNLSDSRRSCLADWWVVCHLAWKVPICFHYARFRCCYTAFLNHPPFATMGGDPRHWHSPLKCRTRFVWWSQNSEVGSTAPWFCWQDFYPFDSAVWLPWSLACCLWHLYWLCSSERYCKLLSARARFEDRPPGSPTCMWSHTSKLPVWWLMGVWPGAACRK